MFPSTGNFLRDTEAGTWKCSEKKLTVKNNEEQTWLVFTCSKSIMENNKTKQFEKSVEC